jgi:hypothetical protein
MIKSLQVYLLAVFFLALSHKGLAQINCGLIQNNIAESNELYEQGYFKESLSIIKEIEKGSLKTSKKCFSREFYELKVKLLIAMNERDGLIDSTMKKMIIKDSTFDDVNTSNYSQAFINHFKAFNVYPNIQVGIGTTFTNVTILSKGEFSPVFQAENTKNLNTISPSPFLIRGLTFFSTICFYKHLAAKFELTQNLPTESNLAFDLDTFNHISITENIYSRSYSGTLVGKLGFIKNLQFKFLNNFGLEVGYQGFNIYQSNSNYKFLTGANKESFSTRYKTELNTKPFRQDIVHNMIVGLIYESQPVLNNKRIRLSVSLKYLYGLSDFNRTKNRFDNQIGTQLYYYAENRYRINSLQFQLYLAYNVHYYKNKRK